MPADVPDLAVNASVAACEVVLMPAGALIVLLELTALAAAFNPVLLADKYLGEISC
jgi:hypothetical protein